VWATKDLCASKDAFNSRRGYLGKVLVPAQPAVVTNPQSLGATRLHRLKADGVNRPVVRANLGCAVGAIPEANHGIGLRTLLSFHDVELHLIAFLERFVSVQLDR
jgi:hypothetical protein